MNLLLLESTCDETAAAIVNERLEVLGAVVASQTALHERFGGVVPEIASRAHVERMLPVIHETLAQAKLALTDIEAVAVATTPGLAGSLLVGLCAAKALCVGLDIPLVAFNHLLAHVYACRISSGQEVFPCTALIVSGGHTSLYDCRSALDFRLLGSTIDDAAGEAYDKVASMLRLGFPGGPAIEKAAASGDRKKYAFPRPMLENRQRLDFSFSGLKTAVRYALAGSGGDPAKTTFSPEQAADIAASFQAAVVDVLVGKTMQALDQTGSPRLCVGGGVAANRAFRAQLEQACLQRNVQLFVPPLRLCTDNAVMGAVAIEMYQAGQTADLSIDIQPGLLRGQLPGSALGDRSQKP